MGLAGWTIQLFWNGQVIASTTTLDDGSFSFPGLGNTAYEVCVSGQSGYTQTQPVGGDGCDPFSFNSTIPAMTGGTSARSCLYTVKIGRSNAS